MSRDNMVRLSDAEKHLLEEYRGNNFDDSKPLGEVISALINDETLAEQKQILITGLGTQDQYSREGNRLSAPRVNVVSKPIGQRGKPLDASNLRGHNPDLIVLLTEIPDNVHSEVIGPMSAEEVHLY